MARRVVLNPLSFASNISNTRESVSSDIQTLKSGLKKTRRGRDFLFLSELGSVWISDDGNTLSSV